MNAFLDWVADHWLVYFVLAENILVLCFGYAIGVCPHKRGCPWMPPKRRHIVIPPQHREIRPPPVPTLDDIWGEPTRELDAAPIPLIPADNRETPTKVIDAKEWRRKHSKD